MKCSYDVFSMPQSQHFIAGDYGAYAPALTPAVRPYPPPSRDQYQAPPGDQDNEYPPSADQGYQLDRSGLYAI